MNDFLDNFIKDMRIFVLIEGIITLDLIWMIITQNDRNDYGFLIGGMTLHYINFILKCILSSRKMENWYYWLGLLTGESISLGFVNLLWGNVVGLAEILVLIQCAWIYNKDLFYAPSIIAMFYSISLEYFKHYDSPFLLIKISVVFCLFLLAAYCAKPVETPNKKNQGSEAKLIDISIKSVSDRQSFLEEMPWLTDQKFFVLNEQLSLVYHQVQLQQLMECPTEVNSEYDENQWLQTFLQSQCESLSRNLISIFCSKPKQSKGFTLPYMKQIITTILETNNSHKQFYTVGDIETKLLKLQDYKINIIVLIKDQEKLLVIHLEQQLESKIQNRKYFNTISIQQNNSFISQSNSQNTTQNSLLSNIFQSVSHEFGTYLNCIMSVSEEAISCKQITQEIKEDYFEPIFINSQLLSYILRNIRDYNTILLNQFVLRLQEFSPKQKINEIIKLMNKQLECRGNKIEIICPDDLIVHNDADRYKQIVYQLLSNAIRFTFQGQITIKVIVINQDKIQTMVIDNGIGMNPQEIIKLNEMLKDSKKLFKISKNSVGCGLGLTISNIITKKMSGKKGLNFSSAQNEGSTFQFTITNSQQLYNDSHYQVSQTYVKILNQTYYVECPVSYTSLKQMGMSSQFENTLQSQNSNLKFDKGKRFSADTQNQFFRRISELHKRSSIKEKKDDFEMDDNGNSIGGQTQNLEIIIPSLSTNMKTEIIFYSISSKCCQRVLIVDDEIFNITSLQLILSKFQIKTDKALNGVEALKKCEAKKYSPCKQCLCSGYVVIFLDLNMPIMDGFDTVRALKQSMASGLLPKALCIANTGYADLETKQQAIAAGMDFYLTKPFEIKLLEEYLKAKFPLGL